MSVARAQTEISSPEFSEWIAFRQVDPFPDDKFDLRFAHLCAVIANVFRSKGRRPKARDYLIRWDKPPKQTVQEMAANFKLFATAHNRAVAKRGNNSNTRR